MKPRGKKSSVLLFVMLMIFAASAILTAIAEYAAIALKSRASAAAESKLRLGAYSALNAAIAVLEEYAEIDGGIYAQSQGWGKPLADGRVSLPDGGEAEVEISDESGKIPLRAVKADYVAKILESLGMSENDAQKYADLISDWCDSDDSASTFGAEAEDYGAFSPQPLNRPMESFRELAFIKDAAEIFFDENGAPTELYKKFSSIFSLEPFSKVNLNAAEEDVLFAMMEAEQKDYDRSLYEALRGDVGGIKDGIVWCKDSEELQNRGVSEYPQQNSAFAAQFLKISVTVKRGLGQYKLIAYYADPAQYSSLMSSNSTAAQTSAAASTSKSEASRSAPSADSKQTSQQTTSAEGKFENGAINSAAKQAAKRGSFKVVKIRESGR